MRLVIEGVCKAYADRRGQLVEALSDINLTVGPREFVVLVGPSGCGKSTLLSVVAGLLPPSRGRVYFTPEGVAGSSQGPDGAGGPAQGRDEVAGAGRPPEVAMVFQDFALFPWRTVLGNAVFGLEERGVPRPEAEAVARRWLERLGLSGFEHHFPGQLSGGMRQRVGIARALAIDPGLLLMDEPFSALDAQTRSLLQEELARLWEDSPRAALYVTHNIQEAVFLADRIVVLSRRPGRVVADIPVSLPRPRREELMEEPEFARTCQQIWSLIKEGARAALKE